MNLKILFKGSYFTEGDEVKHNEIIREYALHLASFIAREGHQLIFDGARELDMLIAEKVFQLSGEDDRKIREKVVFMMPFDSKNGPDFGVVKKYTIPKYWSSARTYIVSLCDVLITIGGDLGTADCIEKAILCEKPVFTVHKIVGYPAKVWGKHYIDKKHYFIEKNDADFIVNDILPSEEFFRKSLEIINKYKSGHPKYFFDREQQKKFIEELRKLVLEGKLDGALKRTLDISKRVDRGLTNQLITLTSDYNCICREKALGMSEQREEINRITFSYLGIVDELEDTI